MFYKKEFCILESGDFRVQRKGFQETVYFGKGLLGCLAFGRGCISMNFFICFRFSFFICIVRGGFGVSQFFLVLVFDFKKLKLRNLLGIGYFGFLLFRLEVRSFFLFIIYLGLGMFLYCLLQYVFGSLIFFFNCIFFRRQVF